MLFEIFLSAVPWVIFTTHYRTELHFLWEEDKSMGFPGS